MALQTQLVNVSFAGGVDSKTDEKLVVPGKLTLLENGVFTTGGKIKKRNGYQKIFTAANGQALIAYGNELLALANNQLLSYSKATGSTVAKGSVYTCKVTNKPVIRNSYQQSTPDFDVISGFNVFAWADSRGGVRASVIDQTTDAPIQADQLISSTGTVPKVLAIGDYLFVFYVDSVGLKCRRFNPSSPTTFETEISIATDIVLATPYYDVAIQGTSAVIAYHITGAIKVLYLTQTGTVGAPITGYPNPVTISESPDTCLGILVEQSSRKIWVMWANTTNGVRAKVLLYDFTTVLATTTVDAAASLTVTKVTAAFSGVGASTLFYEIQAAAAINTYVRTNTLTDAGTVGTSSILKRSVGLASKAYAAGTDVLVTCVFDTPLQATLFTVRSDGFIVAKSLSSQAGGLLTARQLPQVVFTQTLKASFASQVKTQFISDSGTFYTLKGLTCISIDYTNAIGHLARKFGENLHITGGFLQIYDGQSVVENGFHLFPEGYTAATSTTGGSLVNGAYLYSVCYEWLDNKGQVHRSSPGVGLTVNLAGGTSTQSVTLTIPTLRMTAKRAGRTAPTIVVYRTPVNSSVSYMVSSISAPLYNDDTVDTLTFTDTSTDAAIISNQLLYTTGGILDNIGAPPCDLIETYKDRLIVRPTEDSNAMWVSKGYAKGEGVNFSDSLIERVNPAGGDITSYQFMDDKLLIFKSDRVFVMDGDGPDGTGANGTLSTPTLISSDAGCPYPDSLVLTPMGTMFQSNKGIYLCSRSLSVGYIGKDVEAYNAQTITAANLIENVNQVRFLTSSGVALMYDYLIDQWSTFTNHTGADSDVWQMGYVYLRNNGEVWSETPGQYQDSNVGYALRIGTAWVKLAGLQGFQRVKRAGILGDYQSAHILRVSVAYDYENAFSSVYTFNAATTLNQSYFGQGAYYGAEGTYGGVYDNVYQFVLHMQRQKCESVKFLFEDLNAGTTGAAYSLADLTLEVGLKSGVNRLRLAKNVG